MAHIRVREEEWSSLSDERQSEIIKIMRDTGLMREGDEIIPDPDAPSANTLRSPEGAAENVDPCIRECNRQQIIAEGYCYGDATCIALMRAAGDACRRACREGR